MIFALLDRRLTLHWRRQLRGTGARAPLDFHLFIFLVTPEPHKLWHSIE